jgi:hypothetical protein
MKKTLALLLALALVFSSLTVSFAEEAITPDAKACQTIGMLVGDGGGVTASYLATTPTRIQAAVMFLRLKGLENDAKAFTGVDNFADAEKAAWAKPIMGYLKANANLGWTGIGNNAFDPNGKIDAKSYYKVMLETLGYKQNTTTVVGDFTWENLLTFAAEKGLKAVSDTKSFTVNNLATATVEALKSNVKGGTKTLVASLVEAKVITSEKAIAAGVMAEKPALAVDSVVAKTASAFVVKFNTAVDDTTKVAISVKRNNTTTAVTTTWNEAKTEATLAFAGVLPQGDYTIGVKVGETDLGTKTVAITKQKVAKIEILGTTLAVTPTSTIKDGNDTKTIPGNGFASYQVFDQYGVDITKTALANSGITFNASVGNPKNVRDGVMEIVPFNGTFLTQFPTATITALCADSAVSTTKSLTVSLSAGTLSDITLNKIVNADNKEVKANDTISKFYIDYTALDINGNPTKETKMVNNGIMFNTGAADELLSSYPNLLKAKLAVDPTDATKTVIVLEVQESQKIFTDTPVVITAMTKTGKSSSITVNVKKPASVDSLTLLTPAVIVAEGDTNVEIPYEAYDQDGNKLTDYADIAQSSDITTINNVQFEKNPDGTLKVVTADNVNFQKGVPQVFQVVTKSGKSSMITIKPDEKAYAYGLTIDSSILTPYMQNLADQGVDFAPTSGWGGGLKVTDQYGRTMNMLTKNDRSVYVEASLGTTSGGAPILKNSILDITSNEAYAGAAVEFKAVGLGTQTITFKLIAKNSKGVYETVATRTASVSVIENKDITGVTVDEVPTLFAVQGNSSWSATQQGDYYQGISVYGKAKNGGQVTLNQPTLTNVQYFVDSSYFTVEKLAYNNVKTKANALPTDKTEATGNLTVSLPLNGSTYTAITPVKSTKEAPVASAVTLSVVSTTAGSTTPTDFTVSGNTVTGTVNAVIGLSSKSLLRYNSATHELITTRANVQIRAKDQYGKFALTVPYLKIVDQQGYQTVATVKSPVANKYSVEATTGLLSYTSAPEAGDWFIISAVSNNGKSLTVKFVVKDNTSEEDTVQLVVSLAAIGTPADTLAALKTLGVEHLADANAAAYKTAINVATAKDTKDEIQTIVDAVNLTQDTTIDTTLKQSVKDAINAINAIKAQAEYTSASWTAFTAARATAIALPETTNTQLSAKLAAINAATAKLVLRGDSELAAANASVALLVQTDYTAESWAAVTAAQALAQTNNTEKIAKAAAINNAIAGLVAAVDSNLQAAITDAKVKLAQTTVYTEASLAALKAKVDVEATTDAQKVIKTQAIRTAIAGLVTFTGDVSFTLTVPTPGAGNTINTTQTPGANKTVAINVVKATASVQFTVAKTETQTITVGGTDASAVTGTYTVNTAGADKTFTLTVSEAGKGDIVYTVTVKVAQ